MPRFGTKTLLIGFALAAVWFSTFGGYTGAQDVRRSMLLLVLVAAAFAAVYGRGRRRAFWAGFAAVMLVCGGLDLQRPLNRYVPDFTWLWSLGMNMPQIYSAPPYSVAVPTTATQGQVTIRYAAPVMPNTFVPATPATRPAVSMATSDTIAAVWTFVLSIISGFAVAFIYTQTRAA